MNLFVFILYFNIRVCINFCLILIRKLSIKGADLEFQRCDTNINGYITWQEYVDEIYAFRNDIEENVIIIFNLKL